MPILSTRLSTPLATPLNVKLHSPLVGLSDFGGSDVLSTANPGGPPGVSGGFWRSVLFRPLATVTSSTRYLLARSNGTTGYIIYVSGTNGALFFSASSGASSMTAAPTYTITAGDIGKDLMITGVHTGAGNLVRIYVNRVEVGSGTAISGYTAYSGPTNVGNRFDTARVAADNTIYGCAGGEVVPTQAQIEAHFDAVKAAGKMVPMPGVSTAWLANLDNASTVVDTVGAVNLTASGALTLTTNASNWGW